jgi:hypothetical protein
MDTTLIEAMDRQQAVVNPMNIAAKIRAENPNIIARAEMDDASINALVLRRLKTLYEIPIGEWRETTNRSCRNTWEPSERQCSLGQKSRLEPCQRFGSCSS